MDSLTGTLTDLQQKRLLTPPDSSKTEQLKGNTYIPQHEVRAELTRTFGFGRWDSQVVAMELCYETEGPNKDNTGIQWKVCYRAGVRLRIRDYQGTPVAEFLEWHADESIHPVRGEAHANAVTSAESYALRRAAFGISDSLGLALYSKGTENGKPLIKGTLQMFEAQAAQAVAPEGPESDAEPPTAAPPTEPLTVDEVAAELDAETIAGGGS